MSLDRVLPMSLREQLHDPIVPVVLASSDLVIMGSNQTPSGLSLGQDLPLNLRYKLSLNQQIAAAFSAAYSTCSYFIIS